MAIDSAPRTPITLPERDSSPTAAMPSIASPGSRPMAERMASAIGRSYAGPSLRTSAGARLSVSRATGNCMRQADIAARTRSRLSLTAASGRPTISNIGMPSTQ